MHYLHVVDYLAGTAVLTQSAEAYLTLTRDVYEAILLFEFFYLIFAYLAYNDDKVRRWPRRTKSKTRSCTR